jgi:hypothetical protein
MTVLVRVRTLRPVARPLHIFVILSEVAAGFLIGALFAPAATKSKNLSEILAMPEVN